MKIVAWVLGSIVGFLGLVYLFVFTPLGNSMVAPLLESQMNEKMGLEAELKKYHLSFDRVDFLLKLDEQNSVAVSGVFSLLEQSFDIAYTVKLHKLENLQHLLQKKFQGDLATQGKITGNKDFFTIEGTTSLAKSDTNYHIELTQLNPTAIVANIQHLDMETLLYMLHEKQYASAKIDGSLHLNNITPHKLDGTVLLTTRKGTINAKVMRNDFNITLPKTFFTMKLNAKLQGDDVHYTYNVHSNLAKISSRGTLKPQPFDIDAKYSFHIKELALLKPLTHADVRGALQVDGEVKGDAKNMLLEGHSDIASSKTSFFATLKEFQPEVFRAKIKKLHLEKLLYMVHQPHYASALIDVNVDIDKIEGKNLQGSIETKLSHGVLNSAYLTQVMEFESPMPKTRFSMKTSTKFMNNVAQSNITLHSTLANLFVKKALFSLKDGSLSSDYNVKIPKLQNLYFVTQRELQGSLYGHGKVQKGKDIDFTFFSKVAGGTLDAKLHNDEFRAYLKKIQSLKLLHMLVYPQVFDSKVDGVVHYNLAKASGTLQAKLSDGKFIQNKVLDLTKKYAHIDLYKEVFKGDVNATVHKENILASVELASNKSSITTRNTQLNTLTRRIDSRLDIDANHHPLTVYLQGDISAPKVKVDATQLIEKEATKVIQKELKKHLNKENINKILKSFF